MFHANVDAGIAESLAEADYPADLAAHGVTTVLLDEHGRLIEHRPDQAEVRSYDAARIAAEVRTTLIATGRAFIAETVFSHESKLDLLDDAHAAGYFVAVHVIVVPEELAVMRVARRVLAGGHSVPERKIRERYRRIWPLAAEAIARSDSTTAYDTSAGTPDIVARFVHGVPIGATRFPAWTPTPLTSAATLPHIDSEK